MTFDLKTKMTWNYSMNLVGTQEAGEKAQSVQCLLSKHEDLHSILVPTQKVGMLAHACRPSTKEAETGGFLASQCRLTGPEKNQSHKI